MTPISQKGMILIELYNNKGSSKNNNENKLEIKRPSMLFFNSTVEHTRSNIYAMVIKYMRENPSSVNISELQASDLSITNKKEQGYFNEIKDAIITGNTNVLGSDYRKDLCEIINNLHNHSLIFDASILPHTLKYNETNKRLASYVVNEKKQYILFSRDKKEFILFGKPYKIDIKNKPNSKHNHDQNLGSGTSGVVRKRENAHSNFVIKTFRVDSIEELDYLNDLAFLVHSTTFKDSKGNTRNLKDYINCGPIKFIKDTRSPTETNGHHGILLPRISIKSEGIHLKSEKNLTKNMIHNLKLAIDHLHKFNSVQNNKHVRNFVQGDKNLRNIVLTNVYENEQFSQRLQLIDFDGSQNLITYDKNDKYKINFLNELADEHWYSPISQKIEDWIIP